ncbi:TonB-dependent receptor [Pontibacter sp. 172403-2]|uniref:SusC/RagA family TonB-linked outer membrane protein n=1 Tax=Pontibacter rufus TaxID=2791028 RepID=UPI0018AF810D|nr:TonB-dependent receptor [Pontibacter sp. 172403-2]MBF9252008.1 TonB-dependent receptor [Pontibacter sp. 172403-2]
MKKLLLLSFILVFTLLQQAVAQNRTVSGTVTDQATGQGLPGVSVIVKGTTVGVATSADGAYSINVPANGTALEFRYIGYQTVERAIENASTINVAMAVDDKQLEEVVVVGYGTKTVRENTGAISSVSGEKISNEPLPTFTQALAGKTAGVQINMNGGTIGDPTSVQIRGVNSITSSSQPLVVIDGVAQIPSDNMNGLRSGGGTRFDPLAMLNPNDIASIEVLKDAASAVIYGSRASNGVILVTTKRGKKGTVQVMLDSKVGWSEASQLPPVLMADDYMLIQNEKAANRFGIGAPNAVIAVPSDIDADGKPDNTDWMGLLYQTGFMHDNTISFSGGAEALSVYGSARFLSQEGIVKPNKIEMGQGRLNLDFTPKKWFKSGLSLSYTRSKNTGVLTDNYVQGVNISGWEAPPNVSPYNPEGPGGYNLTEGTGGGYLGLGNNIAAIGGSNIMSRSGFFNMAAMGDLTRNDNTAEDIRANIYGEITPLAGLTYTSKFGIQYIRNLEDQYTPNIIGFWGVPYNGLLTYLNSDFSQWVWQNYATYTKDFGNDHSFTAVVGAEYQYNKTQWYQAGAVNFADPFYDAIVNGAFTNIQPGQTITYDQTHGGLNSSGLMSYFGRASYSYRDRYMVEAAVRTDAYSAFGENNQWGYFPSISVGWEVTQEDFLNDINWLTYLKLRGSYGEVGNSRIRNPYASQTLYGGSAYGILSGFNITQVGNPDLRWETAKKTDIGFDATTSIGGKEVSFIVDYFSNNIDNMILSAPVLATVGVPNSAVYTNIGSMRNRGFEFSFNTVPVQTKNFSWATSFNYTHINNEVLSLVPSNGNADIQQGSSVASVGKPLGTFKLIQWAGVNPDNGNPRWFAADGTIKEYHFGATGAAAWTDPEGNAVSPISPSSDAVYSDRGGLPTWMGGWNNTFTFKDFDLGIDIIYSGGNYIYNQTTASMLSNAVQNNFSVILDRWTTPGQVTDVPRVYLQDNQANTASTRFLEKADFARVRTITLGYTLNKSLTDKIGISRARVYVQAFNPFLVTGYSGLDPDVNTAARANTSNSNSANNIQLGIDSRATPQPKTYTIGLNVSF